MFKFLQSLFSFIPSTSSYESKVFAQENKYALYVESGESDDFKRYSELQEYLSGPTNLSKKELKALKKEFKKLKKSDSVKTFFNLKRKYSKIFLEQDRWVSKFYEDFSKSEIDPRWLAAQENKQLLHRQDYSPVNDLHIFSPNNVEQVGGMLKIKTKEELKDGLAWDQKFGMIPKKFKYTSGILTTSSSYKQLFGKFEAKIQVKQMPGTYHAFWMGTNSQIPHINVLKFEGNNLYVSAYSNKASINKKLKYKLKNEFYIFTLEWSREKLTWFINGKKVFETANIIDESMYIAFSSGVYSNKATSTTMYVDWVRCFRASY